MASVLVVDDDPMVRLLVRESLKMRGFQVSEAENGLTALKMLESMTPDVIVLDVMMPGMDGFETCQVLRNRPEWRHLPVIMATGLDDMGSIEQAYRVGATDFITKPINWTLLYHRVNYVLRASQTANALRESEERYALTAKGAHDGLFDWDIRTNRVYFSPPWRALVGDDDNEIGDNPDEWFNRIHPDDINRVRKELSAHIAGESAYFESEHRLRTAQGDYRWIHSRGLAVRDEKGQTSRLAGSVTDITRRKNAEAQLLHDALHDALTGLPNRTLFLDRVQHSIRVSQRRTDYVFAVVFLDLDRFKIINDSLGHSAGDALLIELSRRVQDCLRQNDTLARMGGDEFTLLLEDCGDSVAVGQIADRVQQCIQQAFLLNGQTVFTSASIGITYSTNRYDCAEDMLRDADAAMYQAKKKGKARYVEFNSDMHAYAQSVLHLESELRAAWAAKQFQLHYQPIIDLSTDSIVGMEALLRWLHPERGVVEPDGFLSVAEESGLIVPIGRWVIREACRMMRYWQDRLPAAVDWYVSVNISAREFAQPDFTDHIAEAIAAVGVDAKALRIEITERVLYENRTNALEVLNRLRTLGIRLAIDDFGMGSSSLSYLNQFPFDAVKIDRSLIHKPDAPENDVNGIKALVDLAHNLGMTVIAEGSETDHEVKRLKSLLFEYGQGCVFSKPLDDAAMTRMLDARLASENLLRRKA